MNSTNRIIVAGGTGFLGTVLTEYFVRLGFAVTILTRAQAGNDGLATRLTWDGRHLGPWTEALENARAIINLAGRSVDCRYHRRNRRKILNSRVESTRVIGEAIRGCRHPPRVWLNASTATIYRHTFGPGWDESGDIGAHAEAKDAFSVQVAMAWEQACRDAETPETRRVMLRTAMVLGNRLNSVYPVLRRLVRLGLGGRMGTGLQFVSWIHEVDFCRAVAWLMDRDDFCGAVNLSSPHPLSNAAMMGLLREASGVRWGIPAARGMLEFGAFLLRTETELILKSRRVLPGRLERAGFEFKFPEMADALENLRGPSA